MRRRAAAVAAALAVLACPGVAQAAPGPGTAPEYWFDDWDVPGLWASGVRGQGITIAEIDSGVTVVPQLRGRVLPGVDLGTGGGTGLVDHELDAFGHGTAMASIMVARPGPFGITGLAPDARVLPIAVPLSGTTEAGQPDRLADGIRYAAAHGAKIINMSLGGKREASGDDLACSDDEQQAVYYALARGAILTAAVGNTGPDRNAVEDPAACLGVVVVGASGSDGAVASFSTRQPYVTLLAPGVDIPSLGRVAGEAYSGDGTSQATALASAAFALVWSKYPRLTGSQVVARVLATLDRHRTTPSASTGYGGLNVARAVRAQVATTAPDPVAAAVAPFLQRYRLTTASAASAPPAAETSGGAGVYSVGSLPRLSNGRVLTGVGLGGAGVLLLLAAGGLALRRRSASSAAPGGPVDGAEDGPQ